MTVAELIEKLREIDQNMPVFIEIAEGYDRSWLSIVDDFVIEEYAKDAAVHKFVEEGDKSLGKAVIL